MNEEDFVPYQEQCVRSADLPYICEQFLYPMDDKRMSKCVKCGNQTLYINQRMRGFRCITPTCNDQGDAISLIQRFSTLPFAQSLGFLDGSQWKQSWTEDYLNTFGAVRDCMTSAAVFFASRLDSVAEYLNRQGLPRDLCANFLVGAGLGRDDLKNYLLHHFPLEIIRLTGLLNDHYEDRFQEHVVIPLRQYGQVFDFYGRYIGDDAGVAKNSFLPPDRLTVGRGYFNWNPDREHIICVEDILDAMALFHNGHQNAVATGSNNVLDPMHLRDSSITRVWLCFTADQAARERGIRAAQACVEAEVEVRIIEMPDGLSLNEFFLAHPAGDFARFFGTAKTLGQWQIDHPGNRVIQTHFAGIWRLAMKFHVALA